MQHRRHTFCAVIDPDHPAFDDIGTVHADHDDGGDGRLVSGISVFGGWDDPDPS